MLGRIHRIQISKCSKLLVGETCSQLIQEINHRARQSFFFLVDFPAVFTCTVCIISIILTYTNQLLVRIRLKNRIYTLRYYFEYVRIGQTPLTGFSRMSFSVEICIILGMFLAIYFSRKQLVESMYPISGCKCFLRFFQAVPPL